LKQTTEGVFGEVFMMMSSSSLGGPAIPVGHRLRELFQHQDRLPLAKFQFWKVTSGALQNASIMSGNMRRFHSALKQHQQQQH
ncbi:hypothetical protein JRQ81_002423, partial [Phrynocephalus forsythii]